MFGVAAAFSLQKVFKWWSAQSSGAERTLPECEYCGVCNSTVSE